MVIITIFFLSDLRQNYYTVKIIIVFYKVINVIIIIFLFLSLLLVI